MQVLFENTRKVREIFITAGSGCLGNRLAALDQPTRLCAANQIDGGNDGAASVGFKLPAKMVFADAGIVCQLIQCDRRGQILPDIVDDLFYIRI